MKPTPMSTATVIKLSIRDSSIGGLRREMRDVVWRPAIRSSDGTVRDNDLIDFRKYFGGYLFAFDFDGDGSVSASDFIQFRLRFGGSI